MQAIFAFEPERCRSARRHRQSRGSVLFPRIIRAWARAPVGAALCGFPIVIWENVVGIDRAAVFEHGSITSYARHSRLGATGLSTAKQLRDAFMGEVMRLRGPGFRRISLKTGSYEMEALAIRYAADAKLDLLTIDGSGGGTGMGTWNMMDHWGVPSPPRHAKAYGYCRMVTERGIAPPDLTLAGGFAREDHLFKPLVPGAPSPSW